MPVSAIAWATSSAVVTDWAAASGASFTAAKEIVTTATSESATPSEALTVKVLDPVSLATGV